MLLKTHTTNIKSKNRQHVETRLPEQKKKPFPPWQVMRNNQPSYTRTTLLINASQCET